MSINTSRSIATLRGLTAKFDNTMESTKPYWPTKCYHAPSNGRDEQYGMLGRLPQMREWVGERVFNSLGAMTMVINNLPWESSIAIEKDDFDDDRLNMYGMAFEQLAVRAVKHPDSLLFQAQIAGTTGVCMDGQPFYNASHQWSKSGVQSNLFAATMSVATWAISTVYIPGNVVRNGVNQYICVIGGTSAGSGGPTAQTAAVTDGTVTWNFQGPVMPTEEDFRIAYFNMQSAMLSYLDDQGLPFHSPTLEPVDDFVLEVHPLMQNIAEKALLKAMIQGGQSNLVVNPPKVVAVPSFTDVYSVYLNRVKQPLKPFVFQDRSPIRRMIKGLDDREFKDIKFMVDARYNLGYLAWWLSAKLTFS